MSNTEKNKNFLLTSVKKPVEEVEEIIFEDDDDDYDEDDAEEETEEQDVLEENKIEPISLEQELPSEEPDLIEIPEDLLIIPKEEPDLTESFDYKRLEDRLTKVLTRLNNIETRFTGFDDLFSNLQKKLPEILVKEADERITKNLSEHIDNIVKNNFGALKEQLTVCVSLIMTFGDLNKKVIDGVSNYLELLVVKNKILEMQISMMKGKEYSEASKANLADRLQTLQTEIKKIPITGIRKISDNFVSKKAENG